MRSNDSWKTFDEILRLAKSREVDMVLLAGDLFHENKPSRQAMYQVMRSLRENCFGDKPCELEFLSDGTEHFAGAFTHVNYEDENINVAIPVFSIHGNHDDPSGEGNYAALDILQASGLLNYYGRTPEADNVKTRPICLQKGKTKLALYGISNVRDERLFRTFRDDMVQFFRPDKQDEDFFNLLSLHQNHIAHTETGYIPERFLPEWMHLVIWGHEHECKIHPVRNPETGFSVIQPGSSVATSLDHSESIPKHVAIVTITGKEFKSEPIPLKTVRPFIWRDLVLRDEQEMIRIAHQSDNRTKVTQFLNDRVEELIQEAEDNWHEAHEADDDEMEGADERLLPLIRLRVDTRPPPEGGEFSVENPQRFSNRFAGRVANVNDVVSYHSKRQGLRAGKNEPEMPDENVMAQITIDNVKIEKLVQEFLTAQALSILPQNSFSNAVGQYIDKDDKHAMEDFLKDSLDNQVESLLAGEDDDIDEDRISELIEARKLAMEQAYDRGERKRISKRKGSRKPKPSGWDSDMDGPWEESIMSIYGPEDDQARRQNDDDDDGADDASIASSFRAPPARGRGSRGGRGAKVATGTTRKTAAATKKAPAKSTAARGKKRQPFEEDDDDDGDVIMLDDDDDDPFVESQGLFVSQATSGARPSEAPQRSTAATTKPARGKPNGRGATAQSRQSQLNFGTQVTNGSSRTLGRSTAAAPAKNRQEPSEDEISDDDAFEPPPANQRAARAGRR